MKIKKLLLTAVLFFNSTLLTFNSYAQTPNQPGAGNCLSFNGTSNWVQVTTPNNLPIGGAARTIEYWVYYPIGSCGGATISYGDGPSVNATQDFILTLGKVAGIYYIYTDGVNSPNNISVTFAQFPTEGVWSHIAFTVDGLDNWNYYLNGTLQKNGTFPIPLNTGMPNHIAICRRSDFQIDAPLCAGGRSDYFSGQIDEVRIWNTAQSQTQIRDNMCTKLIGNEVGLVGYWRFDETTGNTAFDSQTNVAPNNGTGF